ncbi:MAG: fibrobacter succinogenes major paralogous domain-containing protein [Bacteroidales bacterium]|nr:fibrobacter succinogenes major paralogous domain-containing protein [Bacteroidales bacterium]
MKKYFLTLLQLIAVLAIAFAQVPTTFNMQVAFKDGVGMTLYNQDVNIKISIISVQEGGTVVFSETHSTTTDPKGIANIVVGSIDADNNFSSIQWQKELHIKLEAKLPSENNFTLINTSPLLSVPYALFTNSEIDGVGTIGQTLWHNGQGWVSTSQIYIDPDKVEVAAQQGRTPDEPIFVVRNSTDQVVFAVYESGAVVNVAQEDGIKGNRGGFAVGGFSDQIKSEGSLYMSIMPDEVQFNILQSKKGNRGGFAVGGFSDQTKTVQNFITIHPDSVKINLFEDTTKGNRGGFAVGGFSDQIKGFNNWIRLNSDTTYIRTPTVNLNEDVSADENINFAGNFGTVTLTDIDTNTYNTTRIGNRVWMAQNLKVTHYRDGSPIITNLSHPEWDTIAKGAYTLYPYSEIAGIDTDFAMLANYGLLYNHYATRDSRGLCPTGWVMPSNEDLNQLTNMLGGIDVAGGALKSRRIDGQNPHPRWEAPNTGANNFSGFSAYPGGFYDPNGNFKYFGLGNIGQWWLKAINASYMLANDTQSILDLELPENYGMSIRCIKSNITQPSLKLSNPQSITPNTANVSARITKDGGAPTISKGFVWSTEPLPCIEINQGISFLYDALPFNTTIVGLAANATYYIRAFATNEAGTTYSNSIIITTTDFANCGTITDIDLNQYSTVVINDQCWMRENLKTTKLNDGSEIGTEWSLLGTPAYAMHEEPIYGAAYNGYTVALDNLCPAGWHVPSKDDFEDLITFLGGEEVAGGKLKETGDTHWYSPNTGATNESGFTGLPGGSYYGSYFAEMHDNGYWWTNTSQAGEDQVTNVFKLYLNKYDSTARVYTDDANSGQSVRCIWGQGLPLINAPYISNIGINSFSASSKVVDDGSDPEAPLTARGFVVGLTPDPTILNNAHHFSDPIIEVGEFAHSFTGLVPNTTYYVKAYASNGNGVKYSKAMLIKTYKAIITDIQGNQYFTTQIGEQEWMAQNLNTTQFNNSDEMATQADTSRNFYTFNPDPGVNAVNHGKLYSYSTILDARGICPTGFRLPYIEDWELVINTLGGQSIAGGKMKTIGTLGSGSWEAPNEGATNESGFSAVPAGFWSSWGYFEQNSFGASIWSLSESEYPNRNKVLTLLTYSAEATTNNNWGYDIQMNAEDALTVRCIKDTGIPILTTIPLDNFTNNSASSGGKIVYQGLSSITNVGLVWSQSPLPTLTDNLGSTSESVNDTFTSQITGLEIDTKYYLRAYATNNQGTGYGNQIEFKLPIESPEFEDFETGNFVSFWTQGEPGWIIDNNLAGEGTFSARSQTIGHDQSASLSIFFKSIGGQVKFLRKVSSEDYSDILRFMVNGVEFGMWSGELDWEQVSFTIPAGATTLTWEYKKDYSVSSGSDCAWIDSIVFPPTRYPEVVIGTQTWMGQNLHTVNYANGDPINYIYAGNIPEPNVPYYTYHPNLNYWGHNYGMVYSHGVIKDARGLCPAGWRLPDNSDWTELFTFLGGVNLAGGKLKAVEMDIEGLWDSPNTGATNSSGFLAIPAGYQGSSGYYYGTPSGQPQEAYFWSATEVNQTANTVYSLTHDSEEVSELNLLGTDANSREDAVSVRCIKIP